MGKCHRFDPSLGSAPGTEDMTRANLKAVRICRIERKTKIWMSMPIAIYPSQCHFVQGLALFLEELAWLARVMRDADIKFCRLTRVFEVPSFQMCYLRIFFFFCLFLLAINKNFKKKMNKEQKTSMHHFFYLKKIKNICHVKRHNCTVASKSRA